MKAQPLTSSLIFFLLLTLAGVSAFAASSHVVTKIEDTADGVCDSDCSLREAVMAAAADDTILFSPLFSSPQVVTLTKGHINITTNLAVVGPGVSLLSISGNNLNRIFKISGGAVVTMSGIKIRDGRAGLQGEEDRFGGGMWLIGSTLNLINMEFANNRALYEPLGFGQGGAIGTQENCMLTLTSVYIHHNSAPTAGGVYALPSTVEVKDSNVSNNSGGGIVALVLSVTNTTAMANASAAFSGEHMSIRNSRIIGNQGGLGTGDADATLLLDNSMIADNGRGWSDPRGGLNGSGMAVISNAIITNNQRSQRGGGIANIGSTYIYNSVIIGNQAAGSGGGIYTSTNPLFITNCTISGNNAVGTGLSPATGGGISASGLASNGAITVTNSTITNNQSSESGGGIHFDSSSNGNTAKIRNTIIAGNTSVATGAFDVSGVFVSDGINLIGNTAGSSGWTPADLLNVNPLLAPLGNNGGNTFTHALLPGSPAINAGNNAFSVDPRTNLPLTSDQRGFGRFIGGGQPGLVDVGAFEAFYSTSPVTVGGRVVAFWGRGVDRALVKASTMSGDTIYSLTNNFGYYRLPNLQPGTTYTITVIHKSYSFISQAVTADQDRNDLNFTGAL